MKKEERVYMTEQLLSKKEAASYLRCSTRTIDRYRAMGLLRAAKLRGTVLFRPADLEKAVQSSMERN